MLINKVASLEIWSNEVFIIPALNFLDSIVYNYSGVKIARYHKFRYVAGEMLRIRMANAYPGTRGKLNIEIFLTDSYFEFSIRDKGQPGWFDFSKDSQRNSSEESFRNYMVEVCVDGVGMEKLGKDGQRIYARLKINSPLNFKKPAPYQEIEVLDTNISIKPVVTKEEAIEAIRCIYSEYGYSYSYEKLYYVDSFMTMIKENQLMSFLAVNEHGQTAGHFALAFSDMYKNMPEISTVVIRKEFRGLGLFSKFVDKCMAIAKERKFRALMGQPVAFHPMSQKAFLRAGFTATSLLMSYLGTDLESEYNKNNDRLDLCASVLMIDGNARTTIYPPKELVPLIEKIYGNLGLKHELCDSNQIEDETKISIENNSSLGVTKIILSQAADDTMQLLQDAVKEAIRVKNEMIELVLLLNSPSCQYAYEMAKKCSFLLSGFIPGSENGDYLIMQMLTGDEMDYDRLVTVGLFEELKNDIVRYVDCR